MDGGGGGGGRGGGHGGCICQFHSSEIFTYFLVNKSCEWDAQQQSLFKAIRLRFSMTNICL